MTVLILSPWYAPHAHPRAHRWTALAEYWAAVGHRVVVIAARVGGEPSVGERNGVDVHRCGYVRVADALTGARWSHDGLSGGGPGQGMLTRFYRKAWKQLVYPDDALLWFRPARALARRLSAALDPDALISVSLPLTAHRVAFSIQAETGVRWLADVGDPFALPGYEVCNRHLYGRMARHLEGSLLRAAAAVVVTGHQLAAGLTEIYGLNRVSVIPPLLHPEVSVQPPMHFGPGLHVGYFGALYPPMRTPLDMLRFLEQWRRYRSDLVCHLFGAVDPEYAALFRQHPWLRVHGQVDRLEARRAMAGMDALLSVGNAHPVLLPSKVVEYIASGRPVVHIQRLAWDAVMDFWPDKASIYRVHPAEAAAVVALEAWLRDLEQSHVYHADSYGIRTVAEAYMQRLTENP
jgi:hypothetical protein